MSVSVQKKVSQTKIHNALAQAIKETFPDKHGPEFETVAQAFAKNLASTLADEIESMIKSQAISIIHTPTALVSPSGPVTGVITIAPTTVKIA